MDEISNMLLSSDGEGFLGSKWLDASNLRPLNSLFRTLVIGVGKSGIETLSKLKDKIEKRFDNWEASVKFLGIDSDDADLAKTGLLEHEKFLLHCPESADAFNDPKKREDAVNEWINPKFNNGKDVEALGNPTHNRQVAIAKLYCGKEQGNWQKVKMLITEKIEELNENRGNRHLQVLVVLSLAGGTGSGLVNDIAALTRMALQNSGNLKCNVAGYFYLPYESEMSPFMSNGYAALKEIDFHYSRFQRDQRFADTFIYSHETFRLDASHPQLYDSVSLLSGTYQNIQEAVAQSILLLVSSQNQDELSLAAFESLERKHREATFAKMEYGSGDDYPEDSFHYHSLSVSSVGMPTGLIKGWVFSKLMAAFYRDEGEKSGKPLPEADAEKIRKAALGRLSANDEDNEVKGLELKIIAKVKAWVSKASDDAKLALTRRDVKRKTDDYQAYRKLMEGLVESLEPLNDINQMLDDVAEKYRNLILNYVSQYGPKTIENFICEAGIKSELENVSINVADSVEKEREQVLKILMNAPGKLFFSFSNWKSAYINWAAVSNLLRISSEVKQSIKTRLIEPVCRINGEIQDFAKVIDALATTSNVFDSRERLNKYCNDHIPSFHNLLSDETSYMLARQAGEDAVVPEAQARFRRAVMESFKNNSQKWTDSKNSGASTLEMLDECLKSLDIAETLNQKLELPSFILEVCKAKGENLKNEICEYLANITKRLVKGIKDCYPQDAINYGEKKLCILYPAGLARALHIDLDEIESSMSSDAKIKYANASVLPSGLPDRFSCYLNVDNLPLFSLSNIGAMEDSYNTLLPEQAMIHRNEPGHVDFSTAKGDFRGGNPEPHGYLVKYPIQSDVRQGKYEKEQGLEWRNYPRLALRKAPGLQEEEFMREEFLRIWEEACDQGVIQLMDYGDSFALKRYMCCVFNSDIDYLIHEIARNRLDLTGPKLVNHIVDDLKKGKRYPISLWDSAYLSKGNPDIRIACKNAQRALRRNVPLYIETKKAVQLIRRISQY
ncbi:MAG: tubulin-like doman-containing protein [Clostridiales bacterium]|nr:tubulin-like doman-containing protein [Clostridiales bacterium]